MVAGVVRKAASTSEPPQPTRTPPSSHGSCDPLDSLSGRALLRPILVLLQSVHHIPHIVQCRNVSPTRRSLVFRSFIFEVRPLLLLDELTDNCGPRRFRDNQPIAIVPVRHFKNLADCECRKAFLETAQMGDTPGSDH